MAAKTKEPGEITTIPLSKILDNSAQSRGMGALSNLAILGYGLFEKIEVDKDPIWPALIGDDKERKEAVVALIREHEPKIIDKAESIIKDGILQDPGVVEVKGGFDVVFGMQRCISVAYNLATGASKTDSVQVKVLAKKNDNTMKLLSFTENDNREEESPIDRGMLFKQLLKDKAFENAKALGKEIGKSDQYVRVMIRMVDPVLEDRKFDIHSGKMSVQKALKLYDKRKNGKDEDAEGRKGKGAGKRYRFPGAKKIAKYYEATWKPDDMKQDEWDLWTTTEVRKLIAKLLGFRFKEYAEVEPEPEPEKAKPAPKAEKEKPKEVGRILKVRREKANRLLIALGKADCRTWDDDKVATKLSNIVSIADDKTKVEEELQPFLDKLLTYYQEGLEVKIKKDAA